MSKVDVHNAIDETVVSNGKRAITAPSMANLLHLMVDEGGSGSGGLNIIKLGTLTNTTGDMLAPILTSEEKAHNKAIFDLVKETTENGEPSPILAFDYLAFMAAIVPEYGILFAGSSILMFPMACGYLTGYILQELGSLGFSEAIMATAVMAELTILVAPDGSILLID